jgi:hypothetical protein
MRGQFKVTLGRDEPEQIELCIPMSQEATALMVQNLLRQFVKPEFLKHVEIREDTGN